MNKGLTYGITTYLLWGILPVYWKLLQHIPAVEILLHRMIWSFIFLLIIISVKNQWKWVRNDLTKRTLMIFGGSALILTVNWLTFIWAVNTAKVLEASLGYFINPLISVLLGVIFLKERLRFWQWISIGIAAGGVLYLTSIYGSFPWIGLTLAFSFGFYGLIRKTSPLGSLQGLTLETALQFLPAVIIIIFLETSGSGHFFSQSFHSSFLLIFTGAVTSLPLLLFISAVRKIELSTIGIIQYIGPTLHFILGLFIFSEPFDLNRLIGFCFIWTAVAVYTAESIFFRKLRQR